MIVECPRCSTRYRVDEKRITRENPAFKCSRCGTVFLRYSDDAPHRPSQPRRRTELHRPFEVDTTGTLPFLSDPTPKTGAKKEPPETAAGAGSDPSWAREEPPLEAEPPSGLASLEKSEDLALDATDDLLVRTPRSSFRAACAVMGATVALHLCLALYLKSSHRRAAAFFASLPLVGEALLKEKALACKVALSDVRGSYDTIRDRKRVFTISGEAVNNAATAITDIQIEGTITGGDGKTERKVIFCGNEARFTDLSDREIDLLHQLDPSYSLQPGQSSRFLIVFTDPPEDLREFTARVLSVRPAVGTSRLERGAPFPGKNRPGAEPRRATDHMRLSLSALSVAADAGAG